MRIAAKLRSFVYIVTVLAATAAPFAHGESQLSLGDAVRLALEAQPRLQRLSAEALAARHSAVAARELPDPQLFGGIRDLPVAGSDAWSLRRDTDTQIVIGIEQAFPRAAKRVARSAVLERAAERVDADSLLEALTIERDVGLSWLALWRSEAAVELSKAALAEASLKVERGELDVAAGVERQAELLRSEVAMERFRDALAADRQDVERRASELERWIGAYARNASAASPPDLAVAGSEADIAERIAQHPLLRVRTAQITEAEAGAELARAEYAPDWRVQFGYGNRPEFADMVMLEVGMDLPLFTRNRQDRVLAGALASRDAASAAWEDEYRQLLAGALLARRDLARIEARLEHYQGRVVPTALAAIDAAVLAWSNGAGSLVEVIDARLDMLDAQMTQLDLRHDALTRRVELRYFAADSLAVDRSASTEAGS